MLTVTGEPGAIYGGFSGFLGTGRMELLEPAGPGCVAAALPARAGCGATGGLDAWRSGAMAAGLSLGVTVGCWLARGLEYRRVA